MPSRLRKLMLTAHITSSVGWFGAVSSFLVLAVIGLVSRDPQLTRACYLGVEPITRLAIVPFCFASLATGIAQSLGGPWGLFRHYWVIAKLLLTVFATIALLIHTQPIDYLADAAAQGGVPADLSRLRLQLVVDSSAGLVVLLLNTVLAVFKPRGVTGYGQRKQQQRRSAPVPEGRV
jgi:hypothetical protein